MRQSTGQPAAQQAFVKYSNAQEITSNHILQLLHTLGTIKHQSRCMKEKLMMNEVGSQARGASHQQQAAA